MHMAVWSVVLFIVQVVSLVVCLFYVGKKRKETEEEARSSTLQHLDLAIRNLEAERVRITSNPPPEPPKIEVPVKQMPQGRMFRETEE